MIAKFARQDDNEDMGPINASAYSYLAIGRRLAAIRAHLGLTQVEMARRIGLASGPRWANYEIGTSRIPVEEALKVVQMVGVSLDYIYYGNAALLPEKLKNELWERERMPPIKRAKKEPPLAS